MIENWWNEFVKWFVATDFYIGFGILFYYLIVATAVLGFIYFIWSGDQRGKQTTILSIIIYISIKLLGGVITP